MHPVLLSRCLLWASPLDAPNCNLNVPHTPEHEEAALHDDVRADAVGLFRKGWRKNAHFVDDPAKTSATRFPPAWQLTQAREAPKTPRRWCQTASRRGLQRCWVRVDLAMRAKALRGPSRFHLSLHSHGAPFPTHPSLPILRAMCVDAKTRLLPIPAHVPRSVCPKVITRSIAVIACLLVWLCACLHGSFVRIVNLRFSRLVNYVLSWIVRCRLSCCSGGWLVG